MINQLIQSLINRLKQNPLYYNYLPLNSSVRFYFGNGRIEKIVELTHQEIIMNNLEKLKTYLDAEN